MCFLHKETKDERQRHCVEGSGRLQSDLILIFTKNRFVFFVWIYCHLRATDVN